MADSGLTEVGKYRIIGQIGEGAMGVVYRALDPVLNRAVAIKVMSDALARDDELRNRFLREAQAAGSLQHPNVITIYDFGEVEGHLYIAMEFVAGDDLEDVLAKKHPLTPLKKVDLLIDVLGGLAYAHKRGIVHRDIKPANIRIDEDGRARIMDFGIAHLSSSTMTKTGIMVGTPAYMAPEQIVGGPIVPATDLFSVGAVMFELFTGKKPFAAESLQSVFYKIVSAPAPSMMTEAPELPASLDTIVQKALAKDPADRYATALDMANALTAARAEIDSAARQSRSVSLRSEIATGLAARPKATAPVVAQPKGGRRTTAIVVGAAAVLAAAAALIIPNRKRAETAVVASPAVVTTPAPTADTRAMPSLGSQPAVPTIPVPPQLAPVVPAGSAASVPAAPNKSSSSKSAAKSAASGARDLELFHSIQTTALDARRRAAEAGATADQLQTGDDHNRRATALAAEGKVTDAAARLNLATTAWVNAERDARAASAAAAKPRAVDPKPDLPVAAPAQPPAPVASIPAPAAAPPPAARPVANPSAEIGAVVAAYARAIDSRDVNEVKRAYPGATAAQASGFEQFFATVRSLHATFAVSSLDVQGATAEGRVVGSYDYVTTAGKTEKQPLDFQASFRRDGGSWKLVAVRANH